MTEEELKKLEEDLNKRRDLISVREDKLKKAIKGLELKNKEVEDKRNSGKNSNHIVKFIEDAGITSLDDLKSVLLKDNKETETTKEGDMPFSKEDLQSLSSMIKQNVEEVVGEKLKNVNQQIENTAQADRVKQAEKVLKDAIKTVPKEESEYIKNYIAKKGEAIALNFAQALDNNPELDPKDFIKATNEDIKMFVEDVSSSDLKEAVKQEEQGAKETDSSLSLNGEVTSSREEPKAIENLTKEEQVSQEIKEAQALVEKGEVK